MIHASDTGFMVTVEVIEHIDHVRARQILARLVVAE